MRLLLGVLVGLGVGVLLGAALGIHAEQYPTDETIAVAAEAGVDALDLQGAVNTTGLDPRAYLVAVGELALPPPPACGWPICGPLGQRIYCVEGIESTHGLQMWDPRGWPPPRYQWHAQGWLGWLPPTARDADAAIGDRGSEWAAAARMILGQVRGHKATEFAGIAAGRC